MSSVLSVVSFLGPDSGHCAEFRAISEWLRYSDSDKVVPNKSMWLKRQLGARSASLGQLGSLESEVMERIWACGETSVRDVHAGFAPRLAYTTVMTTLDRLYKKGLLKRRKQGKAFFYRPAFSEQEYQEQLAQHLFGIALAGRNDSQAVLSRFVDVVTETDREMLNRLDELVKAKRRALRRGESQ